MPKGHPQSRVGLYRFCSGGTLYKPSWGYRFGYRFRVAPYRFCSNGSPTTLSILLWVIQSYLILSDTHMRKERQASSKQTLGFRKVVIFLKKNFVNQMSTSHLSWLPELFGAVSYCWWLTSKNKQMNCLDVQQWRLVSKVLATGKTTKNT